MGPHRISNNNGRLMSAAYIVYYSSDLCGSRLYSKSGRLGTTFSQHPHLAQTYILPTTSSPCNSSCTWIPSDNFETSLSKSISFHIKLCHWFFYDVTHPGFVSRQDLRENDYFVEFTNYKFFLCILYFLLFTLLVT